jgi:glucose-6-phosphate 1-dehydrogenase
MRRRCSRGQFDAGKWGEFARRVHYVSTDATKPGGCKPLGDWFRANETDPDARRLYYFSVSPKYYSAISSAMAEEGLNTGPRRTAG